MLFNTFMILVLAGMCAGKTIVQGRVGKDLLSTTGSVLFFNGVYFAVAMLFMLVLVLISGSTISAPTIVYGCAFGMVSVLFQFSATSAMRYGPVSLSVLIANLSCALPIIVGIVAWQETPSFWFFPGIVFMVAALVFSADFKDLHIPHPKKWLAFVAMAFFASGTLNVIQKLHQFTPASEERSAFVMIAYLVSTVVAMGASLLCTKDKTTLAPLVKPNILWKTAIVGLILCSYQQLCLVMAHRMPGSVMYPMLSGMTLVACTLVGVILFRDPFGIKQKLCVICGVGAVVFLSL